MSLAAYSYAKPLHTAALRTAEPEPMGAAERALAAIALAPGYAATARQRAAEALARGDIGRAVFWHERAERWTDYTAALSR